MRGSEGYVSSIYCGSALDGPGIRCVVFLSGCNLRCPFCHNPETFEIKGGQPYTPEGLLERIARYKSYIKGGGVTLSGGEPFLQADFCLEVIKLLKSEGIHAAIQTNCHIIDERLIASADLIIADIKNQSGGVPPATLRFLDACEKLGVPVMLTNVLIKGVNDDESFLFELKRLLAHPNVRGIRILPFKKLCQEKYRQLGIAFPYEHIEETPDAYAEEAEEKIQA
ncbi:MAG: 4Fe-4S cluster-binding domain-containing protein [Clostridiales bacterium]|jgi:pyruvate formate lyase activating enzyme|nr:4Fe-4S cluster-binding domain-containing protein [Clostridiales bacterium]